MEMTSERVQRAYICYKGGSRHEHIRESDYRYCQEVENNSQHETSVKEKVLPKAAEEIRFEKELQIVQERRKIEEIKVQKVKESNEGKIQLKMLEMEQKDKDKWLEERKIKVKEDNARTFSAFIELLKNSQFKQYSNGSPNKKEHNSSLSDDCDSSTEIDSDVLKHIASVVTAFKKE